MPKYQVSLQNGSAQVPSWRLLQSLSASWSSAGARVSPGFRSWGGFLRVCQGAVWQPGPIPLTIQEQGSWGHQDSPRHQAPPWRCGMGTGQGWAGLWEADMGTWTMNRVWDALKALGRDSQDWWCPQCPDSIQDSCSFSVCAAHRLPILAPKIPLSSTYVGEDLAPCSFR